MNYEETRRTVLEAILEAVEMKLINGTSGNIAMRTSEDPNVICITPSSVPYKGMTAEDIAVVRMREDGVNEWIEGRYKPSSEVPMHCSVLRARPDVGATVHTHSMYATICAMGKGAKLLPLTPPHCEFAPVGMVDFFLPGDVKAANWVRDALGENGRVCLIRNHGMFAVGRNMGAAMDAAVYTEEMAQTTVFSKMLGTYEPLPEDTVEALKIQLEKTHAV